MQRLRFEAFLESISIVDQEKHGRLLEFLNELADAFPEKRFTALVECPFFIEIVGEYERFIVNSSTKSPTFAFWNMYIKMTGEFCETGSVLHPESRGSSLRSISLPSSHIPLM